MGTNPPAGAIIDYLLPRDAKAPVTLEILDAKGTLVRRYASNDPLEPTQEELDRQLIPTYWIAPPRALPGTHGMHRWIWDLHYPDPDTTTRGYPISAVPHATPREPQGPTALPGNYVVRLTVDGHRFEAPLQVKADPRVAVAASALEQQLQLSVSLAGLLTDSSRGLLTVQSVHSQVDALLAKQPGHPALSEYARKVKEIEEPLEAAQGQADTLYKLVARGDAAPTAAQTQAAAAVRAKLTPVLARWTQLQKELPALNRQLRSLKLPAVRPEQPPPRDLNVADEE